MGQDPQVIREQIEETRAGMDETIDALGYKTDVKARAKDGVQDRVDAVTDRVSAVKDKIVGQAGDAADRAPSTGDVKDTARDAASSARSGAKQAASVAQANPLGLAIGAAAVGFLAGLVIPASQLENEKIGPVADDLKDQAKEAGHDAVEHGKAVASDAVHAARDAVTA